MEREKLKIFETFFDNLTRSQFCDEVEQLIRAKQRLYIVAVKDVAITVLSLENKFLLDFYNNVDLLAVDGRGLVYASYFVCGRKSGFKEMVGGPGMYYELLKRAEKKGYRLYYFGAKQDVLDNAVQRIRKRSPSLIICGMHNGYLDDNNILDFFQDLNDSRPDIIFVGISSPTREKIIETYRSQFPKCVCFFIGGMIDVEAGIARIAPAYISYLGIEWLWRVIQEPKRLARRYFRTHTKFAYYFLRELFT